MALMECRRYAKCGERIARRETREALTISMAPWMKGEEQTKLWRELQEKEDREPERPILTPERRQKYIEEAKKRLGIDDAV